MDEDVGISDAPSTIKEREQMMRYTTENFSYMPGLGVVPELSVPDFLPDLLGKMMCDMSACGNRFKVVNLVK